MKVDQSFIDWAAEQAASLLAPLGDRWLHVQGVVERACQVGQMFDEDDKFHLITAAYLHDIGYAPHVKETGFHPLDGACYVRSFGCERLACLVAHHSEARFEAALRGLSVALSTFPRERSAVSDALTYCDMTTSPTGAHISLKARASEVLCRYGDADIVSQALRQLLPYASLAVARTQKRLRTYGLAKVAASQLQVEDYALENV